MTERESSRVARELLRELHVRGRRISVRQVTPLVEGREADPAAVAVRFDAARRATIESVREWIDHPEGVVPDVTRAIRVAAVRR